MLRPRLLCVALAVGVSTASYAEFSIDGQYVNKGDRAETSFDLDQTMLGPAQPPLAAPTQAAQPIAPPSPAPEATQAYTPQQPSTLGTIAPTTAAATTAPEQDPIFGSGQDLSAGYAEFTSQESEPLGMDVASLPPSESMESMAPVEPMAAPVLTVTTPCIVQAGTLYDNLERLSREYGGKQVIWQPDFDVPVPVTVTLAEDTYETCVSTIIASVQEAGAPIRALEKENAIIIQER